MGISTFKIENDPSIKMSTKLVWSEGLQPHRIVMREVNGEYIVHWENLMLEGNTWKHRDFYQGYYTRDINKAVAVFYEKEEML
jgi:hypothetical protein